MLLATALCATFFLVAADRAANTMVDNIFKTMYAQVLLREFHSLSHAYDELHRRKRLILERL